MSWQNGRSVLSSYLKMIVVNVLLHICKCNHSVVHTEFMVVFFFCFGFETYLFNFGSLFDFNIGFFYLECTKKFLFYHTPYTRTTCVFSIPFLSLFPLFFHTFTVCTFWEKKIHTVSNAFVHLSYRRRNEKKNQNEIQTRYFTIVLTAIWRSIDVVNCCSNDLSNLLFFFSSFFSLFLRMWFVCV